LDGIFHHRRLVCVVGRRNEVPRYCRSVSFVLQFTTHMEIPVRYRLTVHSVQSSVGQTVRPSVGQHSAASEPSPPRSIVEATASASVVRLHGQRKSGCRFDFG
jgi:hypothetical protein